MLDETIKLVVGCDIMNYQTLFKFNFENETTLIRLGQNTTKGDFWSIYNLDLENAKILKKFLESVIFKMEKKDAENNPNPKKAKEPPPTDDVYQQTS